MKYGESVFDILYLLFAIISGCLMMCKAADKTEKYMALATLILGCGDAFHLVPRVLNHIFVRGIYDDILKASKEYKVERHIPEEVIADIAAFIRDAK